MKKLKNHLMLQVQEKLKYTSVFTIGSFAVEMALSIYLDDYSKNFRFIKQIDVAKFAEAMTAISKILAMSAAKDQIDLISKFDSLEQQVLVSLSRRKKGFKHNGIDLTKGKVRYNLKHGVLEPAVGKVKALKFATEAVITTMRIDDLIKLEQKKGQMPGRHWVIIEYLYSRS